MNVLKGASTRLDKTAVVIRSAKKEESENMTVSGVQRK